MHFEILVEDLSGKRALDILLPRLLGDHTFLVHAYKGIGRIPGNMRDPKDASKRILLDNLPKLLKGYGRTFQGYGDSYKAAVIVVCDLDDNQLKNFLGELNDVLNACHPKPDARFCFAIEEGEAWFLGDIPAILTAYPKADRHVLESYENDSICGTWEKLADAVYPGGSKSLIKKSFHAIGSEKSRWAQEITPHMNLDANQSPSFTFFTKTVLALIE